MNNLHILNFGIALKCVTVHFKLFFFFFFGNFLIKRFSEMESINSEL